MLVLSVDPATSSGYALWRDWKVIDSGTIKATKKEKDEEFVHISRKIQEKFGDILLDALVIEQQYPPVSNNMQVTPKVVAQIMGSYKISCIRGIWMGCVEAASVISVAPATWENAVLSTGRRMKRDQIKEIAKTVAQSEIGRRPKSDESDAICIGMWYRTEVSQKQRLR